MIGVRKGARTTPCRKESRLVIQPTSFAALTWAGAASGSAAESWRIGTVLAARPLGLNPDGLMVLQIGALTVFSIDVPQIRRWRRRGIVAVGRSPSAGAPR